MALLIELIFYDAEVESEIEEESTSLVDDATENYFKFQITSQTVCFLFIKNNISLIFILFFKVGVAILTNLILIPPSILLIGLFEDSRSRISKVTRLRRVIKELKGLLFNDKIKMFYQRNAFIYEGYCINWSKPWWCKIIAYILAFLFTFLL